MNHQFSTKNSDLWFFGFSALKFGSYYIPFIVLKKSDKKINKTKPQGPHKIEVEANENINGIIIIRNRF